MTEQQRQLTRERIEMERDRLRQECRERRAERKTERRDAYALPWYNDELHKLKKKHEKLQNAVDKLVNSGLLSDQAKMFFIGEMSKK